MRKIFIQSPAVFSRLLLLLVVATFSIENAMAQDSATAAEPVVKKKSYTKNTFEGNYLIDNQTVMVPVKGTFEFDIIHRFGTTDHGWTDLFGIFGGANMRLGFSYVPVKNLQLGFGANNYNMQVDGNIKYAIFRETRDNAMPVSLTYFGSAAMDTRARNSSLPIVTTSDRFSYFNQLLLARKITEKFSAQVAFSATHFNNIDGYYDEKNIIHPTMKSDHLAIAFGARYKIRPKTSIIVNYDQPLTQHPMNNPHPNISFGLEMATSGHAFQIFAGNYGYTLPQNNNFLNQNDFKKSEFVIGFNITRLWNF